ncbi:MAG: arsenite methyltransferase [bacterium]
MKNKKIKDIVKKNYSQVAKEKSCGCSTLASFVNDADKIAKSIGYSEQDIENMPEANLGLGCGNPVAFGEIQEGHTVLDLGSGAGLDCFLAAQKVGVQGKVIGVDMTEEMIVKARNNAEKYSYTNVEFRLGEIENLPVEDNSVDIIISNCVINLVPDKLKAFQESYRVLKSSGKVFISDMVLLESISDEQKNSEDLLCSCVAGALLKDDYINILIQAGFSVEIISEDKDLSKKQYHNMPVASLKFKATK